MRLYLVLLAIAGAVIFIGLPTRSSQPPSTVHHETPLGGDADVTQIDASMKEAEVDIASLFTTFMSSASSLAPLHVCVVGPVSLAHSWLKMLPSSPSRRTRLLVFTNGTHEGKSPRTIRTFDRVVEESGAFLRVTSGLLPFAVWHYFDQHPKDFCNLTIIGKDIPRVVPLLRSFSVPPCLVLFDRERASKAFRVSVSLKHLSPQSPLDNTKHSIAGDDGPSLVPQLASQYQISTFSKRIPLLSRGVRDVVVGRSWTSVDLHELDALASAILSVSRDKNATGRLEGHSAQLISERKVYMALARLPEINTICEIGFNMGHSASLWLTANPRARVIMFDMWVHAYSPVAANFLRSPQAAAQFGLVNVSSRLTIIKGSSLETVPAFSAAHPDVRCDILSVDGGHTHAIAMADIENMKKLANPKFHLLFVDDTNCGEGWCVDPACYEHEKRGTITNFLRLSELRGRRGISVFQYNG